MVVSVAVAVAVVAVAYCLSEVLIENKLYNNHNTKGN